MRVRAIGAAVLERWSASASDVFAATLAAALAWFVARTLFGHPHPVFAAIVALVCLAPGLPSHLKQALGLLVGVGIGIAIGELALLFPAGMPLLRGSAGIFIAMMIALPFGLGPVVPIQAGVSAILVLVMGPQTAGYVRMVDSATGIVIALMFRLLLFTPGPVGVVAEAARRMLGELSSGFSLYDIALATADQACARDAIARVSAARDSMVALDSSIGWARRAARWSLRGRLAAAEIGALVARYDRRASTLYAATLLFGEALADALQQAGLPPHWLRERVHRAAESYRAVAAAPLMQRQMPPLPPVGPAAPDWQACVVTLLAAERALRAFAAVPTPPEPSA